MGQALYRKYRSKSLDEIVGQKHITETLSKALKQGKISHAYLFTGPRGVGKTSVARILAHEINGLPYTDDSAHLDIIEIDAASNRRIDEIRELRDKVYVAPTSAKYKVYIIDEVHMLTREAFNALLKTLEEPPEHVVFILATTDAHKLPETIVSRTQRFNFKPADSKEVVGLLGNIAKKEKIKVSKEALELMATHGGGSFRDSVGLLDQASSHSQSIEADDVLSLLGIPPDEAINGIMTALAKGRPTNAIVNSLVSLYDNGYQAAAIAKQLSQLIRQQLIDGESQLDYDTALNLLEKLVEVPTSHNPARFLEICLLTSVKPSISLVAAEPVIVTAEPPKPAPEPVVSPKTEEPAQEKPQKTKPSASQAVLDEAIWPEVLGALKKKHNTLYGVVRMAEPDFSEAGTLKLAFAFGFHQKRIKENGNQQLLVDIIRDLTGQVVSVECLLDKNATPPKTEVKEPMPEPPGDLSAISNIFGGAELLES